MNSKANPILIEMSKQLPDSVQTFKDIQEPKNYEDIVVQARKEIFCLRYMERSMEDGQSAKTFLQQNGYQFLLENSDEEDKQEEDKQIVLNRRRNGPDSVKYQCAGSCKCRHRKPRLNIEPDSCPGHAATYTDWCTISSPTGRSCHGIFPEHNHPRPCSDNRDFYNTMPSVLKRLANRFGITQFHFHIFALSPDPGCLHRFL